METKQTALEWLEETVNQMIYNAGDLGEDAPALMKHIEQAKAMEKEQMKNAYYDGTKQFANDARIDYPLTFNDYYNDTFKQKEDENRN